MEPRVRRPSGPSEVDILKEGVNVLVEAYMRSVDRKAARRYLREIAVLISAPDAPSVIPMHASPRAQAEMRSWLRERLSVWMAEFGP